MADSPTTLKVRNGEMTKVYYRKKSIYGNIPLLTYFHDVTVQVHPRFFPAISMHYLQYGPQTRLFY